MTRRTCLVALAAACLLALPARAADLATGHCAGGESVWFNAIVADSGKLVSLCGSRPLDAADAWLQFRFGAPGLVELSFPAVPEGSLPQFEYKRYTRPRFTELTLAFVIGSYRYAIVESFDADAGPDGSGASLTVTRMRDDAEVASYDLEMTSDPLSMMALEGHVTTKQ